MSVFAKSVILVRLPFFVSLVGVIIRVRFTDTHPLSQPYQYSNPFLNDAGTGKLVRARALSHMGKTEGVGVAGGGQFMSASWVGGMGNHTGTISKQGTRKTFLIIPVRFAIVHFLPRSAPAAPKSVCVLLESY